MKPALYTSLSSVLKKQYGTKVYKLSLQSGCGCPHRNPVTGQGGCTFCSEGGSGDFAAPLLPVEEQIRIAKRLVDAKIPSSVPEEERRYIAYFQSYTNTFGDTRYLTDLYEKTISFPEIAGLSVGTRPDCLEEDKIRMLSDLNRKKPVWVELGLQTIHEKTAERIRRGYPLSVFEDAYRRLTDEGLTVIVHVILGLPGESREEMLETIRYLAGLTPVLPGIKLQLLHILRGTELAKEYEEHPFPVLTMEEYAELLQDAVRLLPEETVVHRLTGDGPKRLLIAPLWSADKKRVLNYLRKYVQPREDR
jgi:radical SAM protein (TIGR01212 family)